MKSLLMSEPWLLRVLLLHFNLVFRSKYLHSPPSNCRRNVGLTPELLTLASNKYSRTHSYSPSLASLSQKGSRSFAAVSQLQLEFLYTSMQANKIKACGS